MLSPIRARCLSAALLLQLRCHCWRRHLHRRKELSRPRAAREPRRPKDEAAALDDASRLLEEAAGPPADAGRGGEEILAAARLQGRARALRSRHRGAGADRVRRQRPHVRARAARLHAGRRRDRRARSGRPASRCTRTTTATASTRPTTSSSTTDLPALRHAVRRQRDPGEGIELRRGLEVHRYER